MNNVDKVLNVLKEKDIDALFLIKKANVNYISGFTDEAAYVLISNKGNYLITDGRFFELAQSQCSSFEVLNWQNIASSIVDTIKIICKNNGIKKLSFEGKYTTYDMYKSLTSSLPGIELVSVDNIIEDLRYIKNKEEIEILKEASRITDEAFEEILNYIKVGMTENEIAARLEYIIKLKGASGIGFETILISGKKTSLPHGKPDNKVIENGDFITMDFGALYKGYTSDMTRTVVVGKPNEKQIEIYNIVQRAQEAAVNSIKSGITSKEPDDVVRKILNDYIEYYYPGLGHGVGLELHEQPFLSKSGIAILEKNCVITVEPGLYIPGWGGVRIEDTVIVKDYGVERLTKSPRDLICI